MSTTYNMAIVGNASALVATLNVTITYGAATSVIATKDSKTIGLTYDSSDDVWTGNLDSTGTWTVYATDGVRTVSQTVNVNEIGVYDISIAAPNIPLGYTQLEWISSTGAVINTGYSPVSSCRVFMKMQDNTSGSVQYDFFDSQYFSSPIALFLLEFNTTLSSPRMIYYNSNGFYSAEVYLGARNTVYTVSTSGRTITINGTTYSISSGSAITTASGVNMNCCHKCKTWYFQMTGPDATTLVRDMVPAKRLSDSEVGMWDKVNNVFYASANSSKFTAGPEVN